MEWKAYEDQTAEFFRGLGCNVAVRARIQGARATHVVDVWVVFSRFGIQNKWVVECKFWQTNVPKEKVLALKSVVEDVGADRGILVSQVGFQPGAVRAAEHTNVYLTGLEELKERAQEDLLLSAIYAMETETIKLGNSLHGLYVSEKTGPGSFKSKPRPGVNGQDVLHALGKLSLLKSGFERARISDAPFLVEIDESGKCEFAAMTMEELVKRATVTIADARSTLERNRPR
jgi:hypothetical protein